MPAPGDIFTSQRQRAPSVARATARERRTKLKRLHDALIRRRSEIHEALRQDLGKPAAESDLSEIFAVVGEARHAMRHLRRWMKPKPVGTRLALLGSRSEVRYDPKGVVLIISPWNFPFNLTFGPLVSAIAAGNCAILKPSELTPRCSALMASIVSEIFDSSEVAVVEGDAEVARELLALKFDHIFFTGSPAVGKIVMKAAAENLASVTLELGGKSPVIIDETANLEDAAKKLAWGKFLNNGQTCIGPDYVLVQKSVEKVFSDALMRWMDRLYGDQAGLQKSRDYGRIVNARHHDRLARLVDGATEAGAELLRGGTRDRDARFFAPTILRGMPRGSSIGREEIFGPVLPLETFSTLDEAIDLIRLLDHPLVLYVFTRDRANSRRILQETRSGDAVINDTLLHFFQLELPFGGVGASGIGKGHGFHGFESFSNRRGVLRQLTRFSGMQLLYPPYTALKEKLTELTMRYF